LLEKIEQVVRLIRSKGVGVYFVTQNPTDIPDKILGQLGNRVQHALRAFSVNDQRAVRAAAQTFRVNPKLDVEQVITQLEVGEALVSMLDEKGSPGVVERAYILPPRSQIGPISTDQRDKIVKGSVLFGHYENQVDRESAYELLKTKAELVMSQSPVPPKPAGRPRESVAEAMMKSAARAAASQAGRTIMRGIFGTLFGGKKGLF
jgi:hypothetical protein